MWRLTHVLGYSHLIIGGLPGRARPRGGHSAKITEKLLLAARTVRSHLKVYLSPDLRRD